MNVQVDLREKTLIKVLEALCGDYGFKFAISREKLDLGDVIIRHGEEELLVIERKSLNDLALYWPHQKNSR